MSIKPSQSLVLTSLFLILIPSMAQTRQASSSKTHLPKFIKKANYSSDIPREEENLYVPAQVDTYMLAEFEFDSLNTPVSQGWYGVDVTKPPGPFFHVDSFGAISGVQSLWCGGEPAPGPPFCGYATLPGYGNRWDDYFESVVFNTQGNVTLSMNIKYDCEPAYDYTYMDYSTDGGLNWVNVITFTGSGDSTVTTLIPSPDSVKVRVHFFSDEVWSDEDGLYDSFGACYVDDISISDGGGQVDMQDFETESYGDQQTLDGRWFAYSGPGFGDFSGMFRGAQVLQEDICSTNSSFLWGFFEGSTDNYACGGHFEQKSVPFHNERNQYIWNEIWSPMIDWNPGGAVPPTAGGLIYEFMVYEDLPLDNLVFYNFKIQPFTGAPCPQQWEERSFAFYGPDKKWKHMRVEMGDLIPPGTISLRIGLACMDFCNYWCGYYGSGICHSHGPLFDRIKLYRLDNGGPIWNATSAYMFQDNFPADGTTTGKVRCDMAYDINYYEYSMPIHPGDSAVVSVSEPNYGLALDATYGGAAAYIHVRSTGGQTGPALSGDLSRWPVVSVGGGWTRIRMDTVFIDAARTMPSSGSYCADLNDSYFVPPDRIDFYFSAEDNNGRTTYWSRKLGTTSSEAAVQAVPMEMQCLPTGTTDILYVDDYDQWGAQPYFDTAFWYLSHAPPDRFDVRIPSAAVGNGLGSRAGITQILNVYRSIIWNSGDLSNGTIGDGINNEKSPDAQLLFDFIDQSSIWDPGLYLSGDGIASEMKLIGSPALVNLMTYIGFNLIQTDHSFLGGGISPLVMGPAPGTIFQHSGVPDTMIAFGGCPGIKAFDVMSSLGSSIIAMNYQSGSGDGAVLTQETLNGYGRTARVVLSGFSYDDIRSDHLGIMDRFDHMSDILVWFGQNAYVTGSADKPVFQNSLKQNYPNPFNPSTVIEYAISDRALVSLKIYDSTGRLVKTLENSIKNADIYRRTWDGTNNSGMPAASGVYFYRLVTHGFTKTNKMVLLR